MKKFFVLVALFTTVYGTQANAQQQQRNGDPAAMMQRMKERVKPELVEKTKITSEQADKVLEVWFNAQRKRRDLRANDALSQEEKTKQGTAIDEARDADLKAIPLTGDQVKEVVIFFEEMRKKQMQERRDNQ